MHYFWLPCLTDGSSGTPEMPALVFAGVRARAPLTLNVGRRGHGNS